MTRLYVRTRRNPVKSRCSDPNTATGNGTAFRFAIDVGDQQAYGGRDRGSGDGVSQYAYDARRGIGASTAVEQEPQDGGPRPHMLG
jgi:hypothetical protein